MESEKLPLNIAIYSDNYDIVKLLLDNGADPNMGYIQRDLPINRALMYRNGDILDLLLERGAGVGVDIYYAIQYATINRVGNWKLLKKVISKMTTSEINKTDNEGRKALYMTTDKNVRQLIKRTLKKRKKQFDDIKSILERVSIKATPSSISIEKATDEIITLSGIDNIQKIAELRKMIKN